MKETCALRGAGHTWGGTPIYCGHCPSHTETRASSHPARGEIARVSYSHCSWACFLESKENDSSGRWSGGSVQGRPFHALLPWGGSPFLPYCRWSGCRQRMQPSGVAESGWRPRSWAWNGRTKSCGRRSGTWRRPWHGGGGKQPAHWTVTCGPARLRSSRRTRWDNGWRGQDWGSPASPFIQGKALLCVQCQPTGVQGPLK